MSLPAYVSAAPDGVFLSLKVQPRASANQIGEPLGSELRVKVTAPPVDAAANDSVLRLLAAQLDWPRSKIQLVRGHNSKHKIVKLSGLSPAEVVARLADIHRP
jgi:uncharacterized protein (TIGR00251 family)